VIDQVDLFGGVETMDGRPRYTERARRVLAAAQEEARLHGAEAMDTEHILLGLLGAEGSIAIEVLRAMASSLLL